MLTEEEKALEAIRRGNSGARTSGQTEKGQDIDVLKLILILKKSGFWIVLFFTISVAIGHVYLRYTRPLFESSSVLKLDIKRESSILGLSSTDPLSENMGNLSGEIELIRSNIIHHQVIKAMNLNVSYYFQGKVIYEERYENSPFSIEVEISNPFYYDRRIDFELISREGFKVSIPLQGGGAKKAEGRFGKAIQVDGLELTAKLTEDYAEGLEGTYFFVINSEAALLDYISRNLRADVLSYSANTIKVSFVDHNRFKAQAIVRKIAGIYLKQTIESKNQATVQTIEFLNEQLEATQEDLNTSETLMEDFMKQHKIVDVKQQTSKLEEKLMGLEEEQISLRFSQNLLRKLRDNLERTVDLSEFSAMAQSLPNDELKRAIQQYNDLYIKYVRQKLSKNDATVSLRNQQARLENAANNLRSSIDQELKLMDEKSTLLAGRIREVNRSIESLPSKETEYVRMKRHYDLNEKFYLLLMDKKAQYGIAKAGTTPEFQVLMPASLPNDPIFPRKAVIYAISTGVASIAAFILILSMYLLSNSITGLSELERLVQSPIMGVVPKYGKEKMEHSKLVVLDNPKAQISEAFRSLRTNLEFLLPRKEKRTITITSTISGEGKTFISLNLSAIIALADQKVLLIDLDMRKPKLHLAFNAPNDHGMSSILIGKDKFADCVQQTPLPNLDFISSGPIPPNPSELILSSELDRILEKAFKKYDLIVIDSPPVGIVTDSMLLMKRSDLAIMVVRANYSKRGFCTNINKMKYNADLKNLAVILNDVPNGNKGYGYGYGYGHGYYDEEKRGTKKAKSATNII